MSDEKSEKISISLPSDVLAAMDAHVAEIRETRSGWIQSMAVRELQNVGRLARSEDHCANLFAAAEEVGFERALAALKRLQRPKVAA
jgi:metal-responsive CopG/Arc/MetJ family transcriptional regulator